MGLIGMMGRTAVITATASATANRMEQRRQRKAAEQGAAQQQQPGYAQQQPAYAQPAPAPAPAAGMSMDEKIAQIERLGQLKAQGVLTEEEFAQQKAKVLAL